MRESEKGEGEENGVKINGYKGTRSLQLGANVGRGRERDKSIFRMASNIPLRLRYLKEFGRHTVGEISEKAPPLNQILVFFYMVVPDSLPQR